VTPDVLAGGSRRYSISPRTQQAHTVGALVILYITSIATVKL